MRQRSSAASRSRPSHRDFPEKQPLRCLSILRGVYLWPAFVGVLAGMLPTSAWGQEASSSSGAGNFTFGYLLVFLAIVLGLMAVCRPGNRTNEIRVKKDEDVK